MKHAFFIAPLISLAMAFPAIAEKIPLSQISDYLNSFAQATGDFTQINADGTVTTGKIYIKRPGRVRFEYAPPNKSLVIAGGGQVAVFDPKSNVPPQQFPLKRTPLNLILARKVDFGRERMVVGHSEDGPATVVRMQDPENPQYGNIQLKFTNNPVELRQWVITDDTGSQTTVILGDLTKGAGIGAAKFNIPQEIRKRGLSE